MIVTIISLSVFLMVGIYVVWNLLRKVERLEDTANQYADYIYNITDVIQEMYTRVRDIDKRGVFEADDEIGFFFTELKNLQTILNSININESTNQEEERP